MIEHCISSLLKRKKEMAYREYVTDALKGLIELISPSNLNLPRYADQIAPKPKEQEPEETAEDVIARIKKNWSR